MARDGKTARREPAGLQAPTRQPVPRPDGDGAVPPPPSPDPDDPMAYNYTTDLAAIRAVVHRYALEAGLAEARAIDLTLAVSEVALDGAKLIALKRLFRAQRVFAPFDREPCLLEVQSIAPHAGRLADPKAVAVDHEKERVVADAVAT